MVIAHIDLAPIINLSDEVAIKNISAGIFSGQQIAFLLIFKNRIRRNLAAALAINGTEKPTPIPNHEPALRKSVTLSGRVSSTSKASILSARLEIFSVEIRIFLMSSED